MIGEDINMKSNLLKITLLGLVSLSLIGCGGKKEEPITNKNESTIIKDATSTDGYLKKEDYKSIAYAYIYNIKEGLKSYESETKGTVKAKVLFINYDIKYESVTHKFGNKFYSKDNSTSALMSIKNEFYMMDKEKILVSKDLKKYNVYTAEDYHKVSYTPDQYTIMGYVFNDQSITDAQVVSDKGDVISIKYTLDNELATHLVKVDLKSSGGLTSYPAFKNIEITLSMKRDFTPVSYSINALYNASKPIIGSADVRQQGETTFSKVNESITIPNEAFLLEQIGEDASEIIINDEERTVKDELIAATKRLDFAKGVNIAGGLTLNLQGTEITANIEADVAFDTAKLESEKLYNVLSLYAKLETDEMFGTLLSLVSMVAGNKLGPAAEILEGFKSAEIIYDGNGSLIIVPVNIENQTTAVAKIKLTDILDLLLKKINLYNLVTGANSDVFTFVKIPGKDEKNYEVEIKLNEDTVKSIKYGIDSFLSQPDYAIVKALINYQDFDSLKIVVGIKDDVTDSLDVKFNYKTVPSEEFPEGEVVSLITLHLNALGSYEFDYATHIEKANNIYDSYQSVLSLKARIKELLANIYPSRKYLQNLDKTMEEYQALSDEQKPFIGRNIESDAEKAKAKVNAVLNFLEFYPKYDLDNLTNQDILELSKAYHAENMDTSLLKNEIGEEKYNIFSDLSSKVDYSALNAAASKMTGEDENAWGLTSQEIKDIKLIIDIAHYESNMRSQILLTLMMAGGTITDFSLLETKINNLYNNL